MHIPLSRTGLAFGLIQTHWRAHVRYGTSIPYPDQS
jgi:hypothetical protein